MVTVSGGVLLATGGLHTLDTGRVNITQEALERTYEGLRYPIPIALSHSDDKVLYDAGLKEIAYIHDARLEGDCILFDEVEVMDPHLWGRLFRQDTGQGAVSRDVSINGSFSDHTMTIIDGLQYMTPNRVYIQSLDIVDQGACDRCMISAETNHEKPKQLSINRSNVTYTYNINHDKYTYNNSRNGDNTMTQSNNNTNKVSDDNCEDNLLGSMKKEIKAQQERIIALQSKNRLLEKESTNKKDELTKLNQKFEDYVKAEENNRLEELTDTIRERIQEEVRIEAAINNLIAEGIVLPKHKENHISKAKILGLNEYKLLMEDIAPAITFKRISKPGHDHSMHNIQASEELLEQYTINASMGRLPPKELIPEEIRAELETNGDE